MDLATIIGVLFADSFLVWLARKVYEYAVEQYEKLAVIIITATALVGTAFAVLAW